MANRLPPGATLLAGAHLDRLRASPVFQQQLPANAKGLLEPLRDATSVLGAWNGPNYVLLVRGAVPNHLAGAIMLAPGVSATGTADYLRQAGAPSDRNALLDAVQPLRATSEIWAIAAGNANLPLTGNAENITTLLHRTNYAELSVKVTDRIAVDIAGICPNADAARQLEETVRAMISVGAAFSRKDPATRELLKSMAIDRQGSVVRISVTVAPAEIGTLLRMFW